jgi:flavodoxin
MKSLVVFYSRTGTSRMVAEKISKALNSDLEEIIDKKSRAGPLGWLSGGKDASQKALTDIMPIKFDPAKYDVVVIGSPIWAGNLTPAIRTYISENKGKIKKAAYFCTQGGNNPSQFFSDIEDACGRSGCATLSITTHEAKSSSIDDKINAFAKRI